MKIREIEFLEILMNSTDNRECIHFVGSDVKATLGQYFRIQGEDALKPVKPGIYLYEDADWKLKRNSYGFKPDSTFPIADNEGKVFYFSNESLDLL